MVEHAAIKRLPIIVTHCIGEAYGDTPPLQNSYGRRDPSVWSVLGRHDTCLLCLAAPQFSIKLDDSA